MGRTIPSFRIASVMEEKEWKPFRNSLDKSDRKKFDQMFSIAHMYNSASSYAAKPILMDVHQRYLMNLQSGLFRGEELLVGTAEAAA